MSRGISDPPSTYNMAQNVNWVAWVTKEWMFEKSLGSPNGSNAINHNLISMFLVDFPFLLYNSKTFPTATQKIQWALYVSHRLGMGKRVNGIFSPSQSNCRREVYSVLSVCLLFHRRFASANEKS